MPSVATIDEIRHANFMVLLSEHKTIQAFADRLERSHSQVSQLKNRNKHSTGGERRGIGDELARYIEAKMKKPPGWMDSPHGADDQPLSQEARYIAGLYESADPERKGIMLSTMRALAGQPAQNAQLIEFRRVSTADASVAPLDAEPTTEPVPALGTPSATAR